MKLLALLSLPIQNFQPPAQDPAILSYQQGSNIVSPILSPTANTSNIRETGLVEKLLHSYGFIQCCDREARLFFHFSEYAGDINTVKIGGMLLNLLYNIWWR